MSNQAKKDCKTLIAVIISAFVYALAMKAFVETGNLFPGGFAGRTTISLWKSQNGKQSFSKL